MYRFKYQKHFTLTFHSLYCGWTHGKKVRFKGFWDSLSGIDYPHSAYITDVDEHSQ